MTFRELSKEEFDKFAINHIPNSPYQMSAYGDTMMTQKFATCYLGILDGDTIKGATMIMVKNVSKFKYGYAPRGYLIDYLDKSLLEEFTKNLRKYLNSKGIVAIKINPLVVKNIYDSNYNLIASNPEYDTIYNNLKELNHAHLGYNNYFEAFKPRHEAMIELNSNYFTLFQNMSKTFKTKVRSAENSGVRIHKGTFNDIKTLYEQAKGKYPRDFKYYEELYNNFNKDGLVDIYYAKVDLDVYLKKNQSEFVEIERYANSINDEVLKNRGKGHQRLLTKKMASDKRLAAAKEKLSNAIDLMAKFPDGITIATVLVIKTHNTITIMLDSYDKKYTSFNAKHLIIWKLMEKFSKEGYHLFNLGGIVSKVSKDDKYSGLNNYKLGFGSKVYEYIGDLEFITNKPLYLMYKNSGNLFKK